MYHLLSRVKESQYARLFALLAVCCVTVFIFININGPSSDKTPNEQHGLRIVEMSTNENDEGELQQQPAQHPKPAGRMVAGGLGAVREKDEDVVRVVDKIKPELETQSGKKFESIEVIHYKTQVVAGTNYFVKAKAKEVDGPERIVHLRIYQHWKGDLELTAYQLDKKLEDELVHFEKETRE